MNSELVEFNAELLPDEDNQCIEYVCRLLVDSKEEEVTVTSYYPLEKHQLINKANEQLRFRNQVFQQKMG